MDKKLEAHSSQLEAKRHSLAHLLAAAVLKKYPDTKLGIGPVIENGFYYDFQFSQPITDKDLKDLEKQMKKFISGKLKFSGSELSAADLRKLYANQPFKLELIDEYEKEGRTLTSYKTGDIFEDLCKGGHVENTSEIDPDSFKLTKLAGAYWRGDEKNAQLTRIYGVAFNTKEELDSYLKMMEEAKKRDHKKLGKELGLFAFSPLVGAGLPLFLPKGALIFDQLAAFIREEKERLGYQFVHIPHIAKTDLYKKSGHLGKYDAMMPIMTDKDGSQFVMKAMNCPHHFELYNSQPHSYKDLPLRIADTTAVYRNEKSGELAGLTRVISITQDDTHHMVRHDQIQPEIEMILGLIDRVFATFGFSEYKIQISVRDPKNKGNYFGSDELWNKSESILIEAVKKWGKPYVVVEGEAAFYGPKIDVMVKDSIGRMWQLTTVQLDFNQPENFKMGYTGEDGKEHRPAVLHVAIFGSIERFMGILIEHFAGHFPLWLSPVQARVIAVSEKYQDYAKQVETQLKQGNIRADLADVSETLGKRIRAAQIEKIPYVLVVGEKEKEKGTVAVRLSKVPLNQPKDKSATIYENEEMSVTDFIARAQKEISEKTS